MSPNTAHIFTHPIITKEQRSSATGRLHGGMKAKTIAEHLSVATSATSTKMVVSVNQDVFMTVQCHGDLRKQQLLMTVIFL